MLAVDEWISDAHSREDATLPNGVPEPGSIVEGGYRIIKRLGTGSMGVVSLAHDETLDRRVAIKFIHPDLLSTNFRERFLDEARAMARVSHPGVLQVHAFGLHRGAPYIVMEFVDGCTLEEWLEDQGGPADVDVALEIVDDVCLGVSAIHAQSTVHQDIKPSNILLDRHLRPRVADLGLAAICRRDQPGQAEFVGTPAYMAPEVAFSRNGDPALRARADVYSLACVCYELFTGRPPFRGEATVEVLMQHATEPVPIPSSLRPGLPEQLDRAILSALEKDPAARTATVEAFRRNLATARGRSLEPERILVADDNEDSRESLKWTLSLEFPNAEIECVPDGLAALEAFQRKAPSVSILDLCMPGLDGMDLTKLFRKRLSSAAMPIIVLTGAGGPKEWRQLAALGADRLLVKPLIPDDVVALVRRSLGARSRLVTQVVT
jgi:serine/threonine-protein kinase